MDSETNPTIAVEDLEAGQDKICGAEETRMLARTGDTTDGYTKELLAYCEQPHLSHYLEQRFSENPRLELAWSNTSRRVWRLKLWKPP